MDEKITIPSNKVDKLTLECLMNKKQYKKYIEKTDPSKFSENERHLNKILKYRNRILELTEELLNEPELLITLDVNEMFDNYSRTLIRYFETKDLEKEDMDVMFDKINEEDEDLNKPEKMKPRDNSMDYLHLSNMKSFWSKHKVIKKHNLDIIEEEEDS